jgi:hypothetical protein
METLLFTASIPNVFLAEFSAKNAKLTNLSRLALLSGVSRREILMASASLFSL